MRLVIAAGSDEPWSVLSRLLAYGAFARELGVEVAVAMLSPEDEGTRIGFRAFSPTPDAPVTELRDIDRRADDTVIFSAPRVHHAVLARYGRTRPRFVHLVQSGLAASAVGEVGYGYRLFHKPMARIVVSRRVEETILRLVAPESEMTRVKARFDLAPFLRAPSASDPFALAINAFDGDFTGRVVDVARQRGLAARLRVVEAATPLAQRAAAYRESAVLLAAPNFGEGVYQPAFEAMAAGCAVVMTDCEARCTLPAGAEPARIVRQRDVEGMVKALFSLQAMPRDALLARRAAAHRVFADGKSLDAERAAARTALAAALGIGEVAA